MPGRDGWQSPIRACRSLSRPPIWHWEGVSRHAGPSLVQMWMHPQPMKASCLQSRSRIPMHPPAHTLADPFLPCPHAFWQLLRNVCPLACFHTLCHAISRPLAYTHIHAKAKYDAPEHPRCTACAHTNACRQMHSQRCLRQGHQGHLQPIATESPCGSTQRLNYSHLGTPPHPPCATPTLRGSCR